MLIIVVSVLFMMSAAALMIISGDEKSFADDVIVVGELPLIIEPLVFVPDVVIEPDVGNDALGVPHEEEPEPEPEPEIIITLEEFIAEPVPERSEELQKLTTQRAETPRGVEYFDNAMFIGDSITTGYRIWREYILVDGEPLENTIVFANGSYGITNAMREVSSSSIHPAFDGVQMRPEDAVAEFGVERVFISLGLNDILYPLDTFLHNYTLLLNNITDKNPDVQIIILPVPPYMHEAQPTPDRNAHIAKYNNALIVLAHELGHSFIDSTAPLLCEKGGLKEEFCGDPPPGGQGCHWVPKAYGEVLRFIVENPAS